MSAAAPIATLAGLLVGSFLNVVAYRMPRGESITRPRSRCPHCSRQVRAIENVPVLSWLFLRGRCAGCSEPIPVRYPIVEAATAVLFATVVLALGTGSEALLGLALVTVLVPVTLIDLEHRIIPNRLLAPAAIAAPLILAATAPEALPEHLIAAAAAGGFLLLAALAYPAGMGMGDVKLAAVLGLYLGSAVAPAMLVALLSGTLVGAVVIARKGAREGRKTAVPFGPFLALGGFVALLAGSELVDWYLRTFVG